MKATRADYEVIDEAGTASAALASIPALQIRGSDLAGAVSGRIVAAMTGTPLWDLFWDLWNCPHLRPRPRLAVLTKVPC